MNVLSYLYGIIMYCAINAPGHGNDVVDELNATDKNNFKEKKRNFLVNQQVTTYQRLELFPVNKNMS